MTSKTLYDKLWESHIVHQYDDGTTLLYIDRHIIHEVTSPQAFAGLRLKHRQPWRLSTNLAVPEHNVPTTPNRSVIEDPISRLQLDTLDQNCKDTGITKIDLNDRRQGIVHVMAPEQGASLPGMSIVCGDSHTSTNGALGTLAFGIGTSEVEHVLATQCLLMKKAKNMLIDVHGELPSMVTAKDLILSIIGHIGTAGGTGYAIEYGGDTIRNLSMEGRMTICNMSIEAGARVGMIAVDECTIDYVQGRPYAPTSQPWQQAVTNWQTLHSDEGTHFDRVVTIDASTVAPQVSWGTSPEMVIAINELIPDPAQETDPIKQAGLYQALDYMQLKPNTKITDVAIDKVFLGSCTNSRIEDLRMAAAVVKGHHIADNILLAMVVPGSGLVKQQAEKEGLAEIFKNAGFEWRESGCSMCLGMNPDQLNRGERCASTSNRNFEGRQGSGGLTHLVSPAMAVAAAVAGHFTDIRTF